MPRKNKVKEKLQNGQRAYIAAGNAHATGNQAKNMDQEFVETKAYVSSKKVFGLKENMVLLGQIILEI